MNPLLKALAEEISANPFEASGDIYHPLPFSEFSNLKTSSNPNAAYRKWEMIQNSLPLEHDMENIKVLDVGANAGFYSFNFAQRGSSVDAYEPHEHYVNIGRKIVEATKLNVYWHPKPLEKTDLDNKYYDVALLLSVFQWIAQGNKNLEEAIEILIEVISKSRILYFELGCNKGKSSIQTRMPAILWIWQLLNDNSDKPVYYLGSSSVWKGGRRYMFVCSEKVPNLNGWQKLGTRLLLKFYH